VAHGLFSLCRVFQMETTQESYLDLFPLDAIVYLTPDSENGKCCTCLRGTKAKIDPGDLNRASHGSDPSARFLSLPEAAFP